MTQSDELVVRVSRKILLVILAVAGLFVLAGLEFLVFRKIFDTGLAVTSPVVRWGFGLFCLGIGGLVSLVTLKNLLIPPVMMRVSRESVWFGTGFGYVPMAVPTRLLQSVSVDEGVSNLEVMGQRKTVETGVCLVFRADPAVPATMVTSMGIQFFQYQLRLSATYMDHPCQEVVTAVKRIAGLR